METRSLLGTALAATLLASGCTPPIEQGESDLTAYGAFALLPTGAICNMIATTRGTLGFIETLKNDPRFQAEFASSLELWGLSLPLPDSPLLNYAVTCSLGPVRNMLELLWYEP